MGEMHSFDLGELSQVRPQKLGRARKIWALFAVVFALMAVWISDIAFTLLGRGPLHPIQSIGLAIVGGGFVFGSGLSTIVVWKIGPGATRIVVEASGLRFSWPSGREDFVPWKPTPRGFVLLDYTVNPHIVKQRGDTWEVRRWNRPPSFLSHGAFEAIVAGARAEGVLTSSRVLTNSTWGWDQCRAVRFERNAPPATPKSPTN